jgi:hypothetical protein
MLGEEAGSGPADPVPMQLVDVIFSRDGVHTVPELVKQTGTDDATVLRVLVPLSKKGFVVLGGGRSAEPFCSMPPFMRRRLQAFNAGLTPGDDS